MITLKEPEFEDYAHIYEARFKPEVVYWADDVVREITLDEYGNDRLLAQKTGLMFERIIVLDGEPIGTITARDMIVRTKQCTLGIVIADPKNWGHGYGTEALKLFLPKLDRFNLEYVVLDTYASNKRAQHCFLNLGFEKRRVYFASSTGRFVLQMVKRLHRYK